MHASSSHTRTRRRHLAGWSIPAATLAVANGPIYYGGANGIFRVEADGSGLRRLTRGDDVNPVVSPDGMWIAFTRSRVIGHDFRDDPIRTLDLYRIRSNGTGLMLLLRVAHEPAWSPDSRKIGFARLFGKATSIWTANADGTSLRRLSTKALPPAPLMLLEKERPGARPAPRYGHRRAPRGCARDLQW